MSWQLVLTVLVALLVHGVAGAQDPDFHLYLEDLVGSPAEDLSTRVLLDNAGVPLEGWSFGVCHDFTELGISQVALGTTSLTANAGEPIEFSQIELTFLGWSTSAVIAVDGSVSLPAGTGYELYQATYVPLRPAISEVCFCDTIGTPPQPIFVDAGIATVVPETECANLIIEAGVSPFTFSIEGDNVYYFPINGFAQFQLRATIAENPANSGFPNLTNAFNLSLASDPSLIAPVSAEISGGLLFLNGGDGPDFVGIEPFPGGITIGVIYDFANVTTFTFAQPRQVARIHFETNPATLQFNLTGDTTVVRWDDSAATPDEPNVVFVNSIPRAVDFFDGVVQLIPIMGTQFIRGDCNFDGIVDLGDGIGILRVLFAGLPLIQDCPAACDLNQDQIVTLADALFIIIYLFNNGIAPAEPFPFCGPPVAGDDCTQIHLLCP